MMRPILSAARTCARRNFSPAVVPAASRAFSTAPADGPSAEQIGMIQEMFKKDPSKAQAAFTQHSVMKKGLVCDGYVREGLFELHADEPAMFGGTDTATVSFEGRRCWKFCIFADGWTDRDEFPSPSFCQVYFGRYNVCSRTY